MLLMGMKMSLTKKPTNPITTNPIAVRNATFVNSLRSGLWHRFTRRTLSLAKSLRGSTTESTASIFDWIWYSRKP
uniref:Protein transport protein Sec61 subunit gamma-like n=1 Tax=Rhizophora mucronata TaxID=61149 RepID=A0A2P2J6J8_RHIMU